MARSFVRIDVHVAPRPPGACPATPRPGRAVVMALGGSGDLMSGAHGVAHMRTLQGCGVTSLVVCAFGIHVLMAHTT